MHKCQQFRLSKYEKLFWLDGLIFHVDCELLDIIWYYLKSKLKKHRDNERNVHERDLKFVIWQWLYKQYCRFSQWLYMQYCRFSLRSIPAAVRFMS